jgi:hypothetical protein
MRGRFVVFPLLLLHIRLRRQKSDASPRRYLRLVVPSAAAAATFPYTCGTHALWNKGCGGGTQGDSARPWQHRSCYRYGNHGGPTLDHAESWLKTVFLLLLVLLQFVI